MSPIVDKVAHFIEMPCSFWKIILLHDRKFTDNSGANFHCLCHDHLQAADT